MVKPNNNILREALIRTKEEKRELEEQIRAYKLQNQDLTERLATPRSAHNRIIGDLCFKGDQSDFPPCPDIMCDPVYRSVNVDSNFSKLLRCGVVQRLDYIRQLPFVVIKSANATHTRLSHSLGVARLAELAVQRILERNTIYVVNSPQTESFTLNDNEKRDFIFLAKVCGLLHDIGHAPFGHTLDRLLPQEYPEVRKHAEMRPDKYFSAKYVKDYLSSVLNGLGVDPDTVAYIFCPSEKQSMGKDMAYTKYIKIIKILVDSDLDVDRMDYLVRDSISSGIPLASINADALIEGMRPVKTVEDDETIYSLAYDESVFPFIEHAIYGRLAMYDSCYETDTRLACESMLTYCVADFLSNSDVKMTDLIKYGDDDLLFHILTTSKEDSVAYKLARELRLRRNYSVIFSLHTDQTVRGACEPLDAYLNALTEERVSKPLRHFEEWREKIIEGTLSKDEKWKILIHVTPKDRFEAPGLNINIISRRNGMNELKNLSDYGPRVTPIVENFARSMPKLRVFANQSLEKVKLQELKNRCEDFFKIKNEPPK